jgi:4-hydroxy-tetrahydrodipicolinate synthase
MIIPRLLSRGSSIAAQRNHFARVLSAGEGIPAVIYNSPYYGYQTRADLFFDLRREHPNLVGYKEFGGAASLSYAAEHIAGSDPNFALLVGVDTQVVHGFIRCGAVGAITGVGNALPKQVLRLVELCQQAARGDVAARRAAEELDAALHVLATFDEGPDLVLYYKHLLVLEGRPEYEHQLDPTDALSPSQREFVGAQWRLFKSWWSRWPHRERLAHPVERLSAVG